VSEIWHVCKTCAFSEKGRPDGVNCKSKRAFHVGFCRSWVPASVHQSTNVSQLSKDNLSDCVSDKRSKKV